MSALADDSDDALMARAKNNAQGAFAILVQRHERKVLAYLRRSLDDNEEARDVCQDVFIEVWRGRDGYEARGMFVAWLFRIARSRASSRGRFRAVRRLFAARPQSQEGAAVRPDDTLEQRQREVVVREALRALPASLRDAVALRHAAGLDHATIASVLGIDEPAARKRSSRGLALLRERMQGDPTFVGESP